jgi:archaellum component FlaF (FlaF/FlaG flagellin family)
MFFGKFRHARKGISTIAAIFMLLLMFTAFIALLVAFFNYNLSANEQMDIELERSKEKIVLTRIELDNESNISNVVINNTGSIEVRIRALYEIANGETKLLFDPSNYNETHIGPTESLIIDIPDDIPEIQFDNQTKIVAATERGTKTLDSLPELVYGPVEPPSDYDPTKLYVGPLMLKFDDFFYYTTLGDGTLDGSGWKPGWIVDEKLPVKLAWKITVMNIDNRNLTITRFSSFNIVSTNSPNVRSWYVNSTDHINREQFLQINQTESITYIWDGPFSDVPQTVSSTYKGSTCMVFLTFFGFFHETDETKTPYAQTIPFEASITVLG